jgi:hypothetical protein
MRHWASRLRKSPTCASAGKQVEAELLIKIYATLKIAYRKGEVIQSGQHRFGLIVNRMGFV